MGIGAISPPDTQEAQVPRELAQELSSACSLAMDGHQLTAGDVTAAREILDGADGRAVVARLAALAGRGQEGPGWAVLRMPADLDDNQLQRAGAALLAALGRPFFSIRDGGRLWIGAETTTGRDPASFGGTGRQGLHIDAPNVERIPDYTSLLALRPDPAGGGHSLVGDLRAALAQLSDVDRGELAEPAYFEGRAEGLHGTGSPRMPFPVLDAGGGGQAWIRWAAKMTADPRNRAHAAVLARYAAALDACATTIALDRGRLLTSEEKSGTWYIIKADFPEHAFNHQRQLLAGGFGCIAIGSCSRCPVETVGEGSWEQVMLMLTTLGVSPEASDVPDVRVPPALSHWPRCNRIIGEGSWDIPLDGDCQ